MSDSGLRHPAAGSEDFYRLLFQRAAVAVVATDADFKIVAWNQAAGDLLGRAPEEMIGRPIVDAVPEARRKLFARLLERTRRGGQLSEFDVRLADERGKDRNLLVILSPIPAADGQAQGVAAWVVDETKRAELADRLQQAEKMASLGTLAGGIAHHFNNIFGGVATFVDYALTSADTAAMKRALQMTAEAASRVSKITRSLLSFAKYDVQEGDLADLTEVVLTFVHLIEKPLAEKGVEVRLDLHPAPVLALNASRMHQVLGNLLSNAEEAMPAGGTVTITVDRRGDEIALTFADTGPGIDPEHLPLVFEPFFTTKGLLAGGDRANPGLGLSVAHGIIAEMGGKITIDSQDGKGARLTISFALPAEGE